MILNSIRSLRWTDFFIYAVTDPRNLYRIIQNNDPSGFGLSFTIPLVVAVTEILATSLLGQQTSFFYYKITYGWIFNYILLVFFIVITASLMDMMSQFLGFTGRVKEIITVVNFSIFPKVFLLPLVYIFKSLRFAPGFFYFFFSLGFFIWSAIIAILAVSEMNRSDNVKSVMVFLFPILLVSITGFFLTIITFFGGITMLFG